MGKKNGEFVEISNNKAKAKGKYINDIKDGLWTEWFPNGSKMTEAHYTGNIVNGSYDEWYDTGQKKEEKTYLNGKLNGKHSRWFNNGQVVSILNYVNGEVVDGQYFFFTAEGNFAKELNYNNGKKISEYMYRGKSKNGYFVECYPDGSFKIEGRYINGKRKIDERYGAVKTAHQIVKGIGSAILIIALIALSAVTGAL